MVLFLMAKLLMDFSFCAVQLRKKEAGNNWVLLCCIAQEVNLSGLSFVEHGWYSFEKNK